MGTKNQRAKNLARRKFHNQEARRLARKMRRTMEEQMQGQHTGAENIGGGVSGHNEPDAGGTPPNVPPAGADVQYGSVHMQPTDAERAAERAAAEANRTMGGVNDPDPATNPAPPEGADTVVDPQPADAGDTSSPGDEHKGHDHGDDWDENDLATLTRMVDEGKSTTEIAAALGRTPKAVGSKRYRMKKAGR